MTKSPAASPALSMAATVMDTIATRRIAILAAPGVIGRSLDAVKNGLEKHGAVVEVVSLHLGNVLTSDGVAVEALRSLLNTPSVVYDDWSLTGMTAPPS